MASPSELQRFDEGHSKLTKSANTIISLNGLLLAGYWAILTITKSSQTNSNLNLTALFNASSGISNFTGTINHPIPSFDPYGPLINLFFILPVLISLLFSLGAIHAGMWDRVPKGYISQEELVDREKRAYEHYRHAAESFTFGVITLYSISFSLFQYPLWAILTVWGGSVAVFLVFVFGFKMFNQFDSQPQKIPKRAIQTHWHIDSPPDTTTKSRYQRLGGWINRGVAALLMMGQPSSVRYLITARVCIFLFIVVLVGCGYILFLPVSAIPDASLIRVLAAFCMAAAVIGLLTIAGDRVLRPNR